MTGVGEGVAPLTPPPLPIPPPPDRLELEAAQKFLERAAVENLVRAAPPRPIPPRPHPCVRAFPPSWRPRPQEPTPPHLVPLPPRPVQPNPAIGKPVGVSRPGARVCPMARRAGVIAVQSPCGLRAAVQREGEREGREVRLHGAACSARVGVGEPGLGAMWKLCALLPAFYWLGPAFPSCPMALVAVCTDCLEPYPFPAPLVCAHGHAWHPTTSEPTATVFSPFRTLYPSPELSVPVC